MKVAELREKARELEIDPTGIKKPELIEFVYAAAARAEGFRDIEGILDIDNQASAMCARTAICQPRRRVRSSADDPRRRSSPRRPDRGHVAPMRANDKLPGLAKLRSVNGLDPEQVKKRPKFSDLTPIYPNEPLKMEHGKDSITGRAIDIVSPIGKGQRGLIVSPPKAGKTTHPQEDLPVHRHQQPRGAPHLPAGGRAPRGGHGHAALHQGDRGRLHVRHACRQPHPPCRSS